MNEHTPSSAPPQDEPTCEQLRRILLVHKLIDDELTDDLEDLAAIAWLAHFAHDSTKENNTHAEYDDYAREAFRFVSKYLSSRITEAARHKRSVVQDVTGKAELGGNDA